MKKTVLFLAIITLLSCSGSDDSSSVDQPSNNFFKVNNTSYILTNGNINKQSSGDDTVFFITLTNAEVSTNAEGTQAIIPNELTHLATFTIVKHNSTNNQLPTGTFNFKGEYGFDAYTIQDNIIVEGGKITSKNVVSNESDLINQDGRIIVTKTEDGYNFNFNLTTSLGIIHGQYTGSVTKNY